ncbi:MAG: hypothetical protein BRD55_09155 [Bacteroidetes bacterium SW_9_63_38]|nr:MAG: hypothetical protein BRD55_09155 [Bacteroidetes bacterium SW_9_63_38]
MDSKSTKEDVESRLHQTAEAMSERLASLQDEVSSTGGELRTWIVKNPLKSVGGMLAAGLAVGVLFGGGTAKRHRKRHAQLIDTYLDALRQEVETAVDRGEEPGPALEKALRDRVPLVVYRGAEKKGDDSGGGVRSLVQETGSIVFSTGLSLLAREVIGSLLDSFDIDEVIDEELPDEE